MNRIRRLGRKLLLGLLRFWPEGRGGTVGAWQSVLVIRMDDRVGNLLLTTPLLSALRHHFPAARIGLVCAARQARAIEGTGLYDDLWRFEKRDLWRRPWRFLAWSVALRRAKYDLAIEAGHFHAFSFTGGALAVWSRAPVRIGHRRGESARLLTHAVEKDPEIVYDAAAKLELLRPLLTELPGEVPPLSSRLGSSRAEATRAELGEALVVYPGGRKRDHRWIEAGFHAAVASLVAEFGWRAWIAWGPGEESLARSLAIRCGAELLPPTDLDALAAAFRASRLVLTNDTGPMHLAVAVGAPTVGILLAADGARWASPQGNFRAVQVAARPVAEVVAEIVGSARQLVTEDRAGVNRSWSARAEDPALAR